VSDAHCLRGHRQVFWGYKQHDNSVCRSDNRNDSHLVQEIKFEVQFEDQPPIGALVRSVPRFTGEVEL
jgi:hypothetical protein